MMKYAFKISFCKTVLFLSAIGLTASCSEDASSELSLVEIQPPEMFNFDGVNWRQAKSLSNSDTKLLSRYFKMNPSMIDSSILEGTPMVYHGTKNRRRFYWIGGTATQPIWLCVHFEKGTFQILEGHGNPYQSSPQ